MNFKYLIVLLITSVTSAQHPKDFVTDEALAVLSIKNTSTVTSMLKTLNQKTASELVDVNIIQNYLSQFIANPQSIDMDSEVMVVIEPTKLAPGKRPTGMFGPMPHLVFICKPKTSAKLQITGSLQSSQMIDGWFIASSVEDAVVTSGNASPILDLMPENEVSLAIRFGKLWSQFGPIAQMTGGMAIGTMNKPGPDGVISPETRKMSAALGQAFRSLTAWCALVDSIVLGFDFEDYEMVLDGKMNMKEALDVSINNESLIEMASMLSNSSLQYGMSESCTKDLMSLDIDMIQDLSTVYGYSVPFFLINELKDSFDYFRDNVFSYQINPKDGLTMLALVDVTNQSEYLDKMYDIVTASIGRLLEIYHVGLSEIDVPYAWDINMISANDYQAQVMNTVIPKGNQLRFQKQGESLVMMWMGPKEWNSLVQKRNSPLVQVLSPFKDSVQINYAMAMDMRSLAVGILEIAEMDLEIDDVKLASGPTAECSLLIGMDSEGYMCHSEVDLFGLMSLSDIMTEK